MIRYQIGTEEPRQVVGSRAARSHDLQEAIRECQEYSLCRRIKKSWLREVEDGKLGRVLVTFIKGSTVL